MQDELYIAFRQSFELMHGASVPTRQQFTPQQSEYPKWTPFIVFAMFICAAILSGVHTIPTVYDAIQVGAIITETVRQIASVLSFVAIEISAFMAAYMLSKDKGMAWGVLIVAFSVAMISNLSGVSKAIGATDAGGIIVSVILGFGMPLLALMSGKMYVNINRAERYAIAKSEHDYQQAREAFDLSVLSAYNEYVKSTGRKRTRPQPSVSVSADTSRGQIGGQPDNVRRLPSEVSGTAKADKRTLVADYFGVHPDQLRTPARQLEEVIGVGKTIINEVQRTILSSQSGHDDSM